MQQKQFELMMLAQQQNPMMGMGMPGAMGMGGGMPGGGMPGGGMAGGVPGGMGL